MQALELRTTPAFQHRFRSVGELRKALEEYTAIVDLELYGKKLGDGRDPDPTIQDTRYRIMAQNREIDRRVTRLTEHAPAYARLIHWYYRTGNSVEAEGWRIAAKRAGFPNSRRMYRGQDMSRRHFDVILDLALRELFHVH